MKALCVRQPWTELIARGIKTLEVRSWSTSYRGPLLIVASQARYVIRGSDRFDQDPFPEIDGVRGAMVCIVDLVDVLTEFDHAEHQRAACVPLRASDVLWKLARPRRVQERSIKGRLSLFDVANDSICPVSPA